MTKSIRHLSEFKWRDIGDGFIWELVDPSDQKLAEVSFEENQHQRWSWYVVLPEEWHYGGSPNPAGLARSQQEARVICEAILLGTVLRP